MAKKKKYQYDKSERKFRAGTFFAGLANILCGIATVIAMAVTGFKIVPMDDAAGQLLWIFLIGSIPFLMFTAIGLIIGVPLIIFGAIDITHGFLPDRYYKGSVVYEIVITILSVIVAAIAIALAKSAFAGNPPLDIVARVFGYVQLAICFLRATSLLWYGIRRKPSKEANAATSGEIRRSQDLDAQKDGYKDPFDGGR